MKNFALIFLGVFVLTAVGISYRMNSSQNNQSVSSLASEGQTETSLVPPNSKTVLVPNGNFEKWRVNSSGLTEQIPVDWDDPYIVGGTTNVPGKGYKSVYSFQINMPPCPMQNGNPSCLETREFGTKSRDFTLKELGLTSGKPTWLTYEAFINKANIMSGTVDLVECNGNTCKLICGTIVPEYQADVWRTRNKRCQTPTNIAGNYYQITINAEANNGDGVSRDVMRIDNVRLTQSL